ncbi:restriction endonuclease [Amycolatopsis thermoflava]|uniref:restriction endonuclease n=1 Tax=Amycolatopsis thermoflava TaxID=84480 RepID=UPI00381D8D1D
MSTWRQFEILAETIYGELSPSAQVVLNDHIRGKLSEIDRQIDVSIRWQDNGQEYLTIVDTKDYRRPADVPDVGQFAELVHDVQASGGILVCASGFTKAAHTYARNRGLQLHNLHDAQSVRWSHALTIPILWTDLTPNVSFHMLGRFEAGDQISGQDDSYYAVSAAGERRQISVLATFAHLWNDGLAERSVGPTHRIHSREPVEVKVIDINGAVSWRPLIDPQIVYEVASRSWLGQFQPSECRGLIDHLDDNAFVVSHLPIGQVPAKRDESWVVIDDPSNLAVTLKGTFVTTEHVVHLDPNSAEFSDFWARYLGS